MFSHSISGNQPAIFPGTLEAGPGKHFKAAFGTFQPNPENVGGPCHGENSEGSPHVGVSDTLSLSHEACESMRGHHRHECHRPQPNVDRFNGLDREISTLEQQLAQYESVGNQEDIVATQQLIARDRAMQTASLQGADV